MNGPEKFPNSSRKIDLFSRSKKKTAGNTLQRRLRVEQLEDRRMLAGVTVGNALDVVNAPDLSSITALVGNDGGDGISLREAIAAANNTLGFDTITFDPNVFTGGANSLIRLSGTELEITESLTIDGSTGVDVVITADANGDDVLVAGTFITDVAASLTNSATSLDDNSRVLNFSALTGDLTLSDLTITGGRTTGYVAGGGGIRTYSGSVTLTSSTVSGNSTAGDAAAGGGIRTYSGSVTLTSSTVSGNSTAGDSAAGGGIFSVGSVTLTSSTVSGNSTTGGGGADGGGIRTLSGSVTLSNSTVSGNSTAGYKAGGGGIRTNSGSVTLTSSTVSGNSTAGDRADGGGILTSTGSVVLMSSTVSGNSTAGDNADGGGILTSSGLVTLTSSTVSGNSTAGRYAYGGGIGTYGSSVTLTSSTMSGNSTAGSRARGGGIHTRSGTVTLSSSTLSGNSTAGDRADGGGIFTRSGTVTLTSSTLSGNSTTGGGGDGGGIYTFSGSVTLTSSTVSGNEAAGEGGGIYVRDFSATPAFTIENSIVAGNTDNGGSPNDLRFPINVTLTINHSLIGVADSITQFIIGNVGNQTGTAASPLDPLLGPLQDNGGPTLPNGAKILTHALLLGSPAIDTGDPAAVAGVGNTPLFDQRGVGFDRVQLGQIDIGAFELGPFEGPFSVAIDRKSTNDSTPEITGRVNDPGATISIDVDGQTGLVAINNGDGTWTLPDDTITALSAGIYDVMAIATNATLVVVTDATNNELAIDMVPPLVTINVLATGDRTPELSGTINDPAATISVDVDGQTGLVATNNGDGTWVLPDDTIAALQNGTYDVVVNATDEAQNVGTDATTDELDINAPPLVVAVDVLTTGDNTPELTGTVNDPAATIRIDVGGQIGLVAINHGDGTWALPDDTLTALSDGIYDVEVTATDIDLNVTTDSTTNELAITPQLFFDDFPVTTLDPNKWSVIDDATIDSFGISEPSEPNAVRFNGNPDGGDLIESVVIDLSARSNIELSYFYQRTGGGNSTEAGDDFILEYKDFGGTWIELERQLGSGPDMTTFLKSTVALPAAALHSIFQFRFRSIGSANASQLFDDWFLDDVSLQATAQNSADFDSDGDVDGADFLAWQRGFGTQAPNATPADGDANGDQGVDADDLGVWAGQFGQPAPLAASPVSSQPLAQSLSEPIEISTSELAGIIAITPFNQKENEAEQLVDRIFGSEIDETLFFSSHRTLTPTSNRFVDSVHDSLRPSTTKTLTTAEQESEEFALALDAILSEEFSELFSSI